jgi:hypothetical protein
MVYIFLNQNPNLGKFWRVLQWKILVYFMAIRSILRPIGILYGHLVHFEFLWYIFHRVGRVYPKNLSTFSKTLTRAHNVKT